MTPWLKCAPRKMSKTSPGHLEQGPDQRSAWATGTDPQEGLCDREGHGGRSCGGAARKGPVRLCASASKYRSPAHTLILLDFGLQSGEQTILRV